jgi:glycosyltransferase involved in cell wall biosynthesis
MRLTVAQLLPELEVGGVEQGALEIAEALVAAGHRAIVVSAGGRLVAKLEALGATHIALPIGRKRLSSLRLIGRLRETFAREHVDVIHARSRLPAWLGWWARQRLPLAQRPRWVTTVHGPYTVNRYSRIMVSGERVIAISQFIHDYITRSYPDVDARRITLIPRGVAPERWPYGFVPDAAWQAEWARALPGLVGKRLLVLPGRLTRWKGQEDFLQLLARLKAQGLPVHGLLAGGAHPRKQAFEQELQTLAATLGVADVVTFLGQRSDLREVMASSACAFSLTGEPEAFGRTTIEALSLGTPVIGYDHGGTGEILRAVLPTGLVAVGDLDAVAARTAQFLQAPPSVPAAHPFTTAHLQRATLAVYEDLCASLGRPRWSAKE